MSTFTLAVAVLNSNVFKWIETTLVVDFILYSQFQVFWNENTKSQWVERKWRCLRSFFWCQNLRPQGLNMETPTQRNTEKCVTTSPGVFWMQVLTSGAVQVLKQRQWYCALIINNNNETLPSVLTSVFSRGSKINDLTGMNTAFQVIFQSAAQKSFIQVQVGLFSVATSWMSVLF